MPIYEYVCTKCGKLTEVIQKVDDPAPSKCPECGGKKLEKVVSRSAFHLKGGGWYSDLYGGGKKSESKTESKPKTETKSDKKKD